MKTICATLALQGLTIFTLVQVNLGELRIEPGTATVRENDSFLFTCSTGGESGLLIFKYNQVNVCTFSTVSGVQVRALPDVRCGPSPTARGVYNLTIERVKRMQNSNDWFCSVGAAFSNKASLDVKYSSNVTSFTANDKEGNLRVREEDGVTLSCHVDANPPGSVIIRKGGAILSRSDPDSMTSFNVTSAQCRDAGVYMCDAKNDVGTGSAMLNLYVECAPSAVDLRPQPVLASSQGQTTLVLSVYAYPPPVFTWYHPLGYLLQTKNGTKVSESQSSSSLEIEDISSKDFGDYTVTVENDIGIANFTVTLKEEEGLSGGLLVGVVAGGVVLAIFILLFICVVARKLSARKRDRELHADSDHELWKMTSERENVEREDAPLENGQPEVRKPGKIEKTDEIKTEEPEGRKTGRDEDGLMYIGVEVDVSDQSRMLKEGEGEEDDGEGERTQYAEVDVHTTAARYQD